MNLISLKVKVNIVQGAGWRMSKPIMKPKSLTIYFDVLSPDGKVFQTQRKRNAKDAFVTAINQIIATIGRK